MFKFVLSFVVEGLRQKKMDSKVPSETLCRSGIEGVVELTKVHPVTYVPK